MCPSTSMREESWVWDNREWWGQWRTGGVHSLADCCFATGHGYASPDLGMFSSIKSRNLSMNVVSPLVFKALGRPDKKHLRARCAFLVCSSRPLLTTVYSYTVRTTVLLQVISLHGHRESSALECLPDIWASLLYKRPHWMSSLTRDSFPLLPMSPEPSLVKQFSYSVLLGMVFPPICFSFIAPWPVMAGSQHTVLWSCGSFIHGWLPTAKGVSHHCHLLKTCQVSWSSPLIFPFSQDFAFLAYLRKTWTSSKSFIYLFF